MPLPTFTPSALAQLIDEAAGASSWITDEAGSEVLEVKESILVISRHSYYDDVLLWWLHEEHTGPADAYANGDLDEADNLNDQVTKILALIK